MIESDKQLNILLLTEYWAPQRGGIQRYLFGLVQELKTSGHSVQVIEPSTKRFFYPIIKPAWLPLFISVFRLASREKLDVLLCGKSLFEGLLAQMIKKYLGIPYVVFTYAMEIEEWAKRAGTKRKLERVLRDADRVVYINEETKRQLIELGVNQKRLVQIQPGVSPLPRDSSLNTLAQYGLSKPYIISVGRLIPRKGFDDLIRGLASYSKNAATHTQLVIVGDGPERKKLEALAKELNCSVIFTGAVEDAVLGSLLAGAVLFAFTPKRINGDIEGFGIVYLEAALAGLPAIGTKHGGVPEAVLDGKTGILVKENSPDQIAMALQKLLSNPDLCKELGDAAKTRALEQFTWQKQGDLAVEALRDIVNK